MTIEQARTVEETVQKISSRILRKPVSFTADVTFKQLGADSLDIVQILVAIEDTYGIELSDDDLKLVKTVAGFMEYVKKKVAGKP